MKLVINFKSNQLSNLQQQQQQHRINHSSHSSSINQLLKAPPTTTTTKKKKKKKLDKTTNTNLYVWRKYMSSSKVIETRRCTMICVHTTTTILLCYLFTCCTIHLVTLAQQQDTHHHHNQQQQQQLPVGGGGSLSLLSQKDVSPGSNGREGAGGILINWNNKDEIRLEDLKHDNVHKLMSEQDLRRTFQVDSHDQVPEYEILKLTVNDDGSHLISPISDLGELTTTTTTTTTLLNTKTTTTNKATTSDRGGQEANRSPLSSSASQAPTTTIKTSTEAENHHQTVRHKRSAAAAADEDESSSYETNRATGASSKLKSSSDRPADAKVTSSNIPMDQQQQHHHHEEEGEGDNKLIVMNLSTFGRDFKLRLKRNVDFQQRIKDMKMFMAESTKDGQLRYTEIKSHPANQQQQQQQQQQQHHHHQEQRKQEPHKREATASQAAEAGEPIGVANGDTIESQSPSSMSSSPAAVSTATSSDSTKESGSSSSSSSKQKPGKRVVVDKQHEEHLSSSSAANVFYIVSTYHDEDNLAALLIDHDRKTGQLQVDGTIGNDFVIKPMPQATMETLQLKHQQDLLRRQQRQPTTTTTLATEQLASTSLRLDKPSSSNNALDLSRSSSSSSRLPTTINTSAIQHMHDDDPHDDDEMFLDEDEALELAHLQSSASIESNHTKHTTAAAANNQTSAKLTALNTQLPQQTKQQQPRALSKAASERKWKKYRKLMAQTQVPKPAQIAERQQQAEMRARRHTTGSEQADPLEELVQPVRVSHHIIYRQKPSSEGSSSEHQHSFMVSPADYSSGSAASMEKLAVSFSAQRLAKRSANDGGDDNMIDSGRLSDSDTTAQDDADFLHDPLGGQFYLEPGSFTGVERAGYSDWSLMSSRRFGSAMAPPPYALNGSLSGQEHELLRNTNQSYSANHQTGSNRTQQQQHRRYRRHAQQQMRVQQQQAQVRRKRQAPDTVWPEVLLVVDYDSFLLHGGDSRDVKRYFVSFWNGVDLRYKLLVHPHIRISLAGMIVAKDRDATPYLERNRLRAPNADAVDAAGALTDMGKYLYREDRLPTYDLAVVITKLDMCRRRYDGGRCNRGTAGFAYVGGACVVNKRLEKVNSVAIIEDSGGFSGIIVAAHEVGHLLGCVHDGSPPPSYLGGPGATHCPWEDGFIMSDLRHTERGFRWSQCSVEQFKHFLNGETATCLYNYPHESQMLHRLLPGTMLSLDEQCKRDRGTNACFKDARVCAQLFCFDSASGYCVSYRPAAEGSPCGEGQVCRNGKCVGEIENIIPDYTHQSQTVVARGRSHGVSRLADNGLSASSTSTATSSPDNKLAGSSAAAAAAVAGGATIPQLTSRMDTFSPVDTPALNGATGAYSAAAHPFGGRYSSGGAVTQSVSQGTSAHNHHHHHQGPPMKSANLIDFGSNLNINLNGHNRRSGQQALPKPAGAMNQNVAAAAAAKPYGSYHSNNNQQHHHHLNHNINHSPSSHGAGATSSALYTSASSMSNHHQAVASTLPASSSSSAPSTSSLAASSYPHSSSTSGGNNLLTSVSTSQLTKAKNKQQQQQLYDNQRILYQPITQQESQYNNYNRNVNHHQPSSSSAAAYSNGPQQHLSSTSSHRLYTSSLTPQTSITS